MTPLLWRASRLSLALVAALVGVAFGLRAQSQPKLDAEALRKGYDTYLSMRQASPFRSNTWMYAGPTNVSGRATDVAVADKTGQRRIYAAYATSGVWKTDDNGATWQSIFDDMASTSIGDLAVAPSNPDMLWVGTGEANIFRASMAGVGLYKSTDGGKTFQHMGLTDTQTIARILVDPTNPDIVYVAASGHEWTDNEMRGVFKTTDGGKTWTKILYRSPRTGAIDLVMHPRDPNTLYAAMWQRVRRKWSDPRVEPGYKEGGIMKTTDGGKTWTDVSQGLPAPEFRGRIGIDISVSNPNVLYAFVDNYEIGLVPKPGARDAYGRLMPEGKGFIKGADVYRTDDAGKSWRQTSRNNQNTIDYLNGHSGTYGWVFGQIRVDPKDENTIYTMGLALNVSRDGGQNFARISGMHGDHHGLWIDPANTAILYNANDGGFYQSEDAGKTWKFAVSAGGAQFYNVTLDTSSPVWAYGSIQDHGSRRGRIDIGGGRGAIKPVTFENAPGGEGSHHAIDSANPNIVYSHGFYGNFSRTDLGAPPPAPDASGRGRGRGGNNTPIQPKDPDAELRAQWMAPIIVSPHDGSIIYAGFQSVFRSENRGDSWQKISADLTDNNKTQMGENPTAIPYQTIASLAESPKRKGLLYVGSDDGRLHVTLDTGKEWTELTSKLPVRRWISRIVASEHAEGTVYITQRGREDDDFGVYVYKSTDHGRTIRSIAGNIPAGPVNVIREDPRNPDILYVGTDVGVYISTNGGERWEVLGSGLPSNQVSDLQFQPRDQILVISTYGRGMWALDASGIK
ncbi:MAG TPA: hypothetical protein VES67_22265 [Vicinamibacterales bacterium]|nr:hypothetical protein [Vicinamibacterales bacterium]